MKTRKKLALYLRLLCVFSLLVVAGFSCSSDVERTEPEPDDEPDTYTKLPLLMVHGLNGRSSNFDTIKQRLVDAGYPQDLLFTIDLVPNNSVCDPGHVEQIENRVEEILRQTGFDRIDLLCHSNGGTDSMNYMRYSNGIQCVRNWVSIGGSSNFECSKNFAEPPPRDATPGSNVLYTSIYSTADKIVPNGASVLDGGRNIVVSGISHVDLLFSESVFDHIWDGLQGNGSNEN